MRKLWRFLRWLYFAMLWVGSAACTLLTITLWHRFPFQVLGVAWIWFAGAAMVALALVALNATLEIGATPLPPAVPPRHELSQWQLFALIGPIVAFIFALDTGILFITTHWLMQKVVPVTPYAVGKIILVVIWVGWFGGTIAFLQWVAETDVVSQMRDFLRYRLLKMHTLPADIRRLLERSDLPPDIKQHLLARLGREGLTEALADDLLEAAGQDAWEAAEAHRSTATALLVQAINNWKEEEAAKE